MSNKSSGTLRSLDPPRKHNKDVGLKLALGWIGWVQGSKKSGIEQESPGVPSRKGMSGEEPAQTSGRAVNPVSLTTTPERCITFMEPDGHFPTTELKEDRMDQWVAHHYQQSLPDGYAVRERVTTEGD